MTQFFLNGAIKNALTGGVPRELSNSEKIGAAVGSGVLSSVVASPLELMMVQQQVKGTGLLETAVSLIKESPQNPQKTMRSGGETGRNYSAKRSISLFKSER